MSTTTKPPAQTSPPQNPGNPNTYFHQQRSLLVSEIATALDTTLHQLNRLNRSLESLTAVGNEFSSVEALWTQFEGVMGSAAQQQQQNADPTAKSGQGAEEGSGEKSQSGNEDDDGQQENDQTS
ncbi:hypothetical protein EJ08DRAFT_737327 [Tothia fuscella]|uniref:DASH complex subunit DAD1 n=1 Tax=Tothia fuscella TaxID=1048955 RepID=A0A9P4NJB0_9PEZI|nr:hypothetical protein EJ08DRAFT_737327 [Tothia fuscella]